jgi:hypothetical protein
VGIGRAFLAALVALGLVACGGGGGGVAPGGGPAGGGTPWTITTVDGTSSNVGSYPSIALGPTGHVFVSYHDAANQNYKFAKFDGSSWALGTIASSKGPYIDGSWSSIAVDSKDAPHVSFHVPDSSYRYAKWTGSAWSFTTIPATETPWAFLGHNRIAISPTDDTPSVISWMSHSSGNTPPNVLAYWKPGMAASLQVDGPLSASDGTSQSNGIHCAVTVDSTGAPHASFVHWNGQPSATSKTYTAYAHSSGGVWSVQTIEESPQPSTAQPWAENFTAIAVDGSNKPHVFYSKLNEGYKYATLNGSTWTIEKVGDVAAGGYHAQYIALDKSGTPHVCFYGPGYHVYYGKRTGANTWSTQIVDTSLDDTGYGCGLAVDGNGKVHIAYRDSGSLTLRYATR